MRFDLTWSLVASVLLILLVLLTWRLWRGAKGASAAPKPPRQKRDPKPFAGLTHKPECALCEQGVEGDPPMPGAPPPRMIFTRGRRRQVEAAEHLEAFSRYHLHDLYVEQVQMDERFALLSAVKEGELTEAQAIKRLSRSPHWVWVAMAHVCKHILAVDVGDRTLAMAQRPVHQVTLALLYCSTPKLPSLSCRCYSRAVMMMPAGIIRREEVHGPRGCRRCLCRRP